MAVSEVDLGNQALAKLMRGSLQHLNGSDIQTLQINTHLASAKEEVIEEYDWPHCRVIQRLIAVTLPDSTLRGWTYGFAKPSDALAIWRVSNARGVIVEDWEIGMTDALDADTTYIFADTEELYIRFGSSRVSLGRFSATVIDLMATKLAIKMCMPLTKDRVLLRDLRQSYTLELSAAKTKMANMEPEQIDVEFIPETIAVRSS